MGSNTQKTSEHKKPKRLKKVAKKQSAMKTVAPWSKVRGEDGLLPRQVIFCREYVVSHNASKSARVAGYSPHSAGPQGAKLLQNDNVRKKIEQLESTVLDDLEITAYYVASRLKQIADEGTNREATRVLEILGKWKGLWADRSDQVGDVVFTMEIPRSTKQKSDSE